MVAYLGTTPSASYCSDGTNQFLSSTSIPDKLMGVELQLGFAKFPNLIKFEANLLELNPTKHEFFVTYGGLALLRSRCFWLFSDKIGVGRMSLMRGTSLGWQELPLAATKVFRNPLRPDSSQQKSDTTLLGESILVFSNSPLFPNTAVNFGRKTSRPTVAEDVSPQR